MSLELPLDHSALLASKERLQAFLAEYETKVAQAKEQLHHIEALLNLSFPAPPPRPALPSTAMTVRASRVEEAVESPAPKTRRRRDTSLKLLPPYQGKTLTEAVLSIFQENRGKCLDADTIVRLLYGELSGDRAALAKDRITKNLSKGKIDGLWQRVPGQTGYYTLSLEDIEADLASLNLPKKTRRGRTKKLDQPAETASKAPRKTKSAKEGKVSAPKRRRNSLRDLKMRSPYQGSTMMNAISKVLKEREGEFVNADIVVKALYGELPNDIFRIVKDRVAKSLSKGKIDGLWERVPDRMGYYTLSMSAVRA